MPKHTAYRITLYCNKEHKSDKCPALRQACWNCEKKNNFQSVSKYKENTKKSLHPHPSNSGKYKEKSARKKTKKKKTVFLFLCQEILGVLSA